MKISDSFRIFLLFFVLLNKVLKEITQLQGRLTAAIAKKEESKHLELQLLES